MATFAVVKKGTTEPVRLNDKKKTLLVFDSEIAAARQVKKLNTVADQRGYVLHFEYIPQT